MFKKTLVTVSLGTFLAIFLMPIQLCTPAYAAESEQECWAVIIGIAEYPSLEWHLADGEGNTYHQEIKYPDDDAKDLAQQLSAVWGQDHVKLLLNSEATKVDIYYAIKWLAQRTEADDTVLLYFSGHGYLPPHPYLPLSQLPTPEYVPQDADSVYLCSYDNLISDTELNNWLDRLNSKRVVIILDTCHAGSFSNKLSNDERVVLMSCQPNESSLEDIELKHGVFTHYVLQAFDDFEVANTNSDYELSAQEIFGYAELKTIDEIVKPYANVPATEHKQHPVLHDPHYLEELGLLMKVVFHTDATFPLSATALTVNGVPYVSEELPVTFTWAAGSTHTLDIPPQVDTGEGTRLVFTSWDDGDTSASRTISRGGEYTANYKTQYQLTIESAHGKLAGEGWYDSGSTAIISVTSSDSTIIRQVFSGWNGDFAGTEETASLIVDAPKKVTANWHQDYLWLYLPIAGLVALGGAAGSTMTFMHRRKKAQ